MARNNHEITEVSPLLNKQGNLAEPGWSRKMVQQYRRKDIKASPLRIKEWDYYIVMGDGFGVAFTLNDMSYMGMISASFLNFETLTEHTETVLTLLPMGKFKMPENSSSGDVVYSDDRVSMKFTLGDGWRRIECDFKKFDGEKDLACDIRMEQPDMDTRVIATPWDQKHCFYYNQKINCMKASGWVRYDGKEYSFNPEQDYGTLDWGRGVWTRDNTWYWGSGNTTIDGKPFGFNIGYGFGNTTAASENVIFYDGKAHKIDDVTFHIPEDDYLKPWTFTSSDGRFEMDFQPVLDRNSFTDMKLIISDQHQVFGKMSGVAILDDGTRLEVKNLLCFAEKVRNKY